MRELNRKETKKKPDFYLLLFPVWYNVLMEVIYTNYCPESFGSFLSLVIDEKDMENLAKIFEQIQHTADQGGHPTPPQSRALREVGIDLCEIRIHYKKSELLRIYYFVDREGKAIVLLNILIKPDGTKRASQYEGKARKKVDKEIQKSIQIAIDMYKEYPSKKTNYEPLSL